MTEDLHATLGVPRHASQAKIRHAYLELVKQCHPDLHPNDPVAVEKFKQIHRAFEQLYKPSPWRFRRIVLTPESVLEEIAFRSRPGWMPNPFARRVTRTIAIGLILLGTAWIAIEMAMTATAVWLILPGAAWLVFDIAMRAQRPSTRPTAGDGQKTAVPETEKPRGETEVGDPGREWVIGRIAEKLREETDLGDQKKAVSRIKMLGGRIEVDAKLQGRPVIRVDFISTRLADAGLEHLKGLAQLQHLNLQGTHVTDAGLEHLKGLTRLQVLFLGDTRVTDAGVESLRKALPALTIHR